MKLPKISEPDMGTIQVHAKKPPVSMGYSIEAMEAHGKACAIEALEEAAKLLEEKMRITAATEVRKLKSTL